MKHDHQLDEIREDIEARQKAIVFPDTTRNGVTVDAFLWKGDPKATPIQRAGLIVFASFFLLIAVICAAIPFQDGRGTGWFFDALYALFAFLLSMRLLRNAFLKPPKRRHDSEAHR